CWKRSTTGSGRPISSIKKQPIIGDWSFIMNALLKTAYPCSCDPKNFRSMRKWRPCLPIGKRRRCMKCASTGKLLITFHGSFGCPLHGTLMYTIMRTMAWPMRLTEITAMVWRPSVLNALCPLREVRARIKYVITWLLVSRNTDVYNYANYGLAYAAFRNNSYGMAAEYFERFMSLEGSSIEDKVRYDVMARLGDSYLAVRNYNRANQYYNELINSNAP